MLGVLAMMAMMSGGKYSPTEYIESKNNRKKQPIEPKPENGTFYYWFKNDGTFLNEKQGERMLKEDCVFNCYAINDKNAIKKFNKFNQNEKTKTT